MCSKRLLARVFSILHNFLYVWYLVYILHATSFPCKNGKVREMESKEMICLKTLKPSESLTGRCLGCEKNVFL